VTRAPHHTAGFAIEANADATNRVTRCSLRYGLAVWRRSSVSSCSAICCHRCARSTPASQQYPPRCAHTDRTPQQPIYTHQLFPPYIPRRVKVPSVPHRPKEKAPARERMRRGASRRVGQRDHRVPIACTSPKACQTSLGCHCLGDTRILQQDAPPWPRQTVPVSVGAFLILAATGRSSLRGRNCTSPGGLTAQVEPRTRCALETFGCVFSRRNCRKAATCA